MLWKQVQNKTVTTDSSLGKGPVQPRKPQLWGAEELQRSAGSEGTWTHKGYFLSTSKYCLVPYLLTHLHLQPKPNCWVWLILLFSLTGQYDKSPRTEILKL